MREVTDMFKKPLCLLLSLSVALSCLFSAALFPSAEQSEGAFEEIAKLENMTDEASES